MISEYTIDGMTCGNCERHVKEYLQQLKGVENVAVNLEFKTVKIESEDPVSVRDLNEILPLKYKVSGSLMKEKKVESSAKSAFSELRPLILILSYIFITAFLLQSPWDEKEFMLDFMGIFFLVFSFFKFLDIKGFAQSFRMYDPLAKSLKVYALIYPFFELMLGVMFLYRFKILVATIATLVILSVTTIGVASVLGNKKNIQCACLGAVLKLPMTKATLIENGIMILMGFYMLVTLL